MAAMGQLSVTIEGSVDKRSITGTFAISFDGNFFPVQRIYFGKTTQSLPMSEFPKDFSLSTNPKYFSNTDVLLKFLKEVIKPYITKQSPEMLCGTESTGHHGRVYWSNDSSCRHL